MKTREILLFMFLFLASGLQAQLRILIHLNKY